MDSERPSPEREADGPVDDPLATDGPYEVEPHAQGSRDPLPLYELPTDRQVVTLGDIADRISRSPRGAQHAVVDACPGATAFAVRRLLERGVASLVVVTPDRATAGLLRADLDFVLGPLSVAPASTAAANGATTTPQLTQEPPPAVVSLLAADASPWSEVTPNRVAIGQRLAALLRLAVGPAARVTVVDAASLIRRLVPRQTVQDHSVLLRVTDELDRDGLGHHLEQCGYVRTPLVDDPGSYAMRGGIVDVWPAGAPSPVRMELDGDMIASLRLFDADDQRAGAEIEQAWLPPATELVRTADRLTQAVARIRAVCDAVDWPSSRTRSLIEDLRAGRIFFGADGFVPAFETLEPLVAQLPEQATVVLEDPIGIQGAMQTALSAARAAATAKEGSPRFDFDAFYVEPSAVEHWLESRTVLRLVPTIAPLGAKQSVGSPGGEAAVAESIATWDQADVRRAVDAARASRGFRGSLDPLVRRIRAWQQGGLAVLVATRTASACERLVTMLDSRGVVARSLTEAGLSSADWLAKVSRSGDAPAARAGRSPRKSPHRSTERVDVTVGPLARGLVAPTEGIVLLTEEEVFGAPATRRRRSPSTERRKSSRRGLLSDLRDLGVGDHVVHADHGIGRYQGLVHQQVAGRTVDLLTVEYAGGDRLYVPVYRLNQIQKLRGSEGPPKLDRLGGQTFTRAKARATQRVRQLAEELLRLYAERRAVVGIATSEPDEDYRAFEATFPYEETDDQIRTLSEVSADLEAPRPMDRLVCGDVGFGKTEIALRAAFRVAMAGRQVAVLCPTTVLTQQHLSTFESRLASYPIRIAALSRFQSKPEQQRTVLGLRSGAVDIVIGTHRLLSRDVHFSNLGLLVVDEEQRFGVTAKERIKALRTNVDVLTLSATPIPRTLQMAVGGLRDLSLITTPPADRRAVRTIITRDDPAVLREAIERELDRGGQIFFVHNRIGGLAERAAAIQQLVPRARVAIAHGQMVERTLEQTMLAFVRGDVDLLCCTAIIENGLDIARCNTIIVDRAERYGLAQLYQLRGRVGRSRERAYCYLVLGAGTELSDEARLRLEALQRHSELGSGFQVAALDLDLRGAGDLLGAEQSGTVQSVGFEMFCEMLEQAVHELRGGPVVSEVEPELSFDVEALLPESYVADVGVRLSLYKRLASAPSPEDVAELGRELEDRFGTPPQEARALVHLMSLKTELRRLRVLGCEATAQRVTLHLREDAPLDPVGLARLVQSRRDTYRLTPDLRLSRTSRPAERFANGLGAVERLLAEIGPLAR